MQERRRTKKIMEKLQMFQNQRGLERTLAIGGSAGPRADAE